MVMGSLLVPARMRTASSRASTTSSSKAGTMASTSAIGRSFVGRRTAAGNTLAQAERLGQRPSWWVPASALGCLGLQGGELVDLGLQGGEAGLEGGHLGGRRAVLVVVDDVLGRVPDVGLEVLGPVEQVIDEVLGVVDDVFQEAGEGVLALGHDDQALAPASCSSASWLTLAVSSARAEWRPATSVDETDFSS